jgi:hypothetical protein
LADSTKVRELWPARDGKVSTGVPDRIKPEQMVGAKSNGSANPRLTKVEQLVAWFRGDGSKWRSFPNKTISDEFKKKFGKPVSDETIRQARNQIGLSPRVKGDDTSPQDGPQTGPRTIGQEAK